MFTKPKYNNYGEHKQGKSTLETIKTKIINRGFTGINCLNIGKQNTAENRQCKKLKKWMKYINAFNNIRKRSAMWMPLAKSAIKDNVVKAFMDWHGIQCLDTLWFAGDTCKWMSIATCFQYDISLLVIVFVVYTQVSDSYTYYRSFIYTVISEVL